MSPYICPWERSLRYYLTYCDRYRRRPWLERLSYVCTRAEFQAEAYQEVLRRWAMG